jgi:AcrR family transcriptional regulator
MTTARPPRADVRRNRERLLAAAHELFAEAGADVPREAVARRAGVGIGTVYRHFPTHEALVEAVYRAEVAQLCGTAADLLRQYPPEIALARWMNRFPDIFEAKRGMSGALQSAVDSGSHVFADTRREIVAALASLLEAGAAAGTLRDDVGPEDVLAAMGASWRIQDDPEKARRVLTIVMDGLRRGATR